MKFTAIDFETANASRASACSVGLSFVEDGKIVGSLHQLIRPDPLCFDPWNVRIHGITADDVSHAPTFAEYWPELLQAVQGPLVAHNASFDMSVIRHSLDLSGIAYPTLDYFCTVVIAKRTWPLLGRHTLDRVADHLQITFRHHDACEDAKVCAQVALQACHEHGVSSLYDVEQCCGVRVGRLFPGGYKSCSGSRSKKRPPPRVATDGATHERHTTDSGHPFYGKSFVFTGAMSTMTRRIAVESVLSVGGVFHETVQASTDYIVIGEKGRESGMPIRTTTKMQKAQEMQSTGHKLIVIVESEFLQVLSGEEIRALGRPR